MKYFLYVILSLVLLAITGLAVLVLLVDPNEYKEEIAGVVKRHTGQDLQILGDLSLSVFPWIGLKTGKVVLGNAPGFGPEPLAEIETAEIKVKLLPLLAKKLEVRHVVLAGLRLNLTKNAQGQANWQGSIAAGPPAKTKPETAPEAPAGIPFLIIGGVTLDDGSITFKDEQAGRTAQVEHLNARLDRFRFGDPTDLSLGFVLQLDRPLLKETVSLTTAVVVDKQLHQVELRDLHLQSHTEGKAIPSGRLEAVLDTTLMLDTAAQTLTATEIKLRAADALLTGALQGNSILDAPRLEGDFRLEAVPARVLSTLAIDLPAPSDPKALQKARLDFRLKAGADRLALENLQGVLDDTHITGRADLASFSRPKVTLRLDADALDVDRYLPPAATKESRPVPATTGAPVKTADKPLPLAGLAGLNLDGRVHIKRCKVKGLRMQGVTLTTTAGNRAITLTPDISDLYQGTSRGKLYLDGSGQVPQIALNTVAQDVQIEPLLQDLAGKATMTGRAFVDLNLTSHGQRISEIRQGLSGNLVLRITDGSLNNVELLRLIKQGEAWWKGETMPSQTQVEKLRFVGLDFQANVRQGVMHTDRFLIDTRKLRIQGTGSLDLVREQLDYTVRVVRLKHAQQEGGEEIALAKKGLPVIIKISGPVTQPRYALDVIQMAQEKYQAKIEQKQAQIEKKIEKKKARIEEKITEKLEKKLGEGAGELLKGLLR